MKTVFIILMLLIISYIIWQHFELKKFRLTTYTIPTPKIKNGIRLIVLADLHGYVYGEQNIRLIKKIKECKPQAILVAGDMIVSKYPDTYGTAIQLFEQLIDIAPVYYSYGNHESRIKVSDTKGAGPYSGRLKVTDDFKAYVEKAEKTGVIFLNNRNVRAVFGEDTCAIGGCEIGMKYYEKKVDIPMEKEYLSQIMGEPDPSHFQILLAHNPAYSEQYAAWGAELSLCGHNHGGLIRIPGIGSLISPQLTWFPKYDGGDYEIKGKHVAVSRGLGTHTFHIRIFNRAELLLVHLKPKGGERWI